ncbi:hypothetical protein MTO96_003232 [Rhipicephalus appendiculatus]
MAWELDWCTHDLGELESAVGFAILAAVDWIYRDHDHLMTETAPVLDVFGSGREHLHPSGPRDSNPVEHADGQNLDAGDFVGQRCDGGSQQREEILEATWLLGPEGEF